MTREEYERLLRGILAANEEKHRELDRELRRQRYALEFVWNQTNPGVPPPIIGRPRARRGLIESVVSNVVANAFPPGRPFTVGDVKKSAAPQWGRSPDADHPWIGFFNNENRLGFKQVSVSTVLRRLAEAGDLEIVRSGKGKRATVYRIPVNEETRERYQRPVLFLDPDNPELTNERAAAQEWFAHREPLGPATKEHDDREGRSTQEPTTTDNDD